MERKTAYEILGLDQLLGYTDLDQELTVSELNEIEAAIAKFANEIDPIARNLAYVAKHRIKVKYCVDFDIVRSAIDWLSSEDSNSFWSYLVIDFSSKLNLLPGTLYEIDQFLKRSSEENKKFNYPSTLLSEKLKAALIETDLQELSNSSLVFTNKITASKLPKDRLFVLSLMFKKIMGNAIKMPKADDQIFRKVNSILKTDARINRIINNKADALNYATICKLNDENDRNDRNDRNDGNEKIAYVLVSNTNLLFKADKAIMQTPTCKSMDTVWTPRRAAIFQLLNNSETEQGVAEVNGWTLREKLVSFQKWIVQRRSSQEAITIRSLRKDNIFLQMIATIQEIQFKIDHASRVKELKFNNVDYFDSSAEDFYTEISNYIKEQLKIAGVKIYLPQNKSDLIHNMEVKFEKGINRFKYKSLAKLTDSNGDLICTNTFYDDYNTLFLKNELTGNFPVLRFIEIVNSITENIYEKVLNGDYNLDPKWFEERLDNPRTIRLKFEDGNTLNDRYDGKLEIQNILSKTSYSVKDIVYLRVDAALFSTSYEGDYCAMKYSDNIKLDAKDFIVDVYNVLSNGKHLDVHNETINTFLTGKKVA